MCDTTYHRHRIRRALLSCPKQAARNRPTRARRLSQRGDRTLRPPRGASTLFRPTPAGPAYTSSQSNLWRQKDFKAWSPRLSAPLSCQCAVRACFLRVKFTPILATQRGQRISTSRTSRTPFRILSSGVWYAPFGTCVEPVSVRQSGLRNSFFREFCSKILHYNVCR